MIRTKGRLHALCTFLFLLSSESFAEDAKGSPLKDPDTDLNTPQTIRRAGYPAESHTVQTADGYLLAVHRIPAASLLSTSGPSIQPTLVAGAGEEAVTAALEAAVAAAERAASRFSATLSSVTSAASVVSAASAASAEPVTSAESEGSAASAVSAEPATSLASMASAASSAASAASAERLASVAEWAAAASVERASVERTSAASLAEGDSATSSGASAASSAASTVSSTERASPVDAEAEESRANVETKASKTDTTAQKTVTERASRKSYRTGAPTRSTDASSTTTTIWSEVTITSTTDGNSITPPAMTTRRARPSPNWSTGDPQRTAAAHGGTTGRSQEEYATQSPSSRWRATATPASTPPPATSDTAGITTAQTTASPTAARSTATGTLPTTATTAAPAALNSTTRVATSSTTTATTSIADSATRIATTEVASNPTGTIPTTRGAIARVTAPSGAMTTQSTDRSGSTTTSTQDAMSTTSPGEPLPFPPTPPPPPPPPVVFLQHGLLGSSYDWILAGPGKALAYLLADAGFDVWMGNARGNTYSRAHVYLPTAPSSSFWDFSFHEMGVYDLPAVFEHILNVTGAGKLHYVGHSMGTTMFFVLGSMKPGVATGSVASVHALAPVVFVRHIKSPIRLLAPFAHDVEFLARLLGVGEFLPQSKILHYLAKYGCELLEAEKEICENLLFILCGYDKDQFNKTLLPALLSHTPAGASTQTLIHYAQMIRSGKFQQYDFGKYDNLKQYRSSVPPEYNLSNVNVPINLMYGSNDWLASVMDVEDLYNTLKCDKKKYLVPLKSFNHLDFILAKDVKKLLYDTVVDELPRVDDFDENDNSISNY